MKKLYLVFAFALCSAPLFSQTLFTYGNASVDKEEFLRAYNKNKTPVADKEKALREYLELYTKFKLKVKAAADMHLDTLQQLKTDLQNFRTQIEESYLNNEKELNALLDEAFLRSQKDIHVIHFFCPIDSKMSPEDTLGAYRGMKELQEKLNTGATNYEELAENISKNYQKTRTGDLGYITVFTLPYDFENIIYALKKGESSKPFRARNGLHVFKVIGERKSVGTWKVAQILLAYPPGDAATYTRALEAKADSIYNALQHGADFTKMAGMFSDDKLTYLAGGELPEFGTGKYDPAFEAEVFKLTRDGEVGKPFASQFGIHIIKRLKQTATPEDKNDASFSYEIKQKVLQDLRIIGAKEKFVKEIMAKVGYKKSAAVKDADLFRFADSAFANKSETQVKYPISDKPVLTFTKGNVKGSEWLTFVREFKNNPEFYKGETNPALFDKFVSYSVLDYYKKHLDEYSADFRYQMEEFRDGNILFEIMERNVWGNASADSAGLQKQYNENKGNYLWAPSASVILFNCNNKATAADAVAALKNGKEWKAIVAEGNNNIQADSGRYEIAQLPLPAGVVAEAGMISEPMTNTIDGSAGFIKIIKLYPGNLQRSFDEARGLVINDYQNILEERWINELKKKYPVKVNEEVFRSLLK